MSVVTCRTEDCSNAGEPIELATTFTDDEGLEQTVDAVVCGVCGNVIEDVAT